MKKYVILGASVAGISAVEVLRQQDKDGEIVLVSEDTEIYSKPLMHYYLSGDRPKDMMSFVDQDFMETNKVAWEKGKKAVGVDTDNKEVLLSDGTAVKYDKLLIATGSFPVVPEIEGVKGAKNACTFHSLSDCRKVMEMSDRARDIVIVGAGLVGLDAALGLLSKNKNIEIVDIKEHMLALQLDAKAAKVYQEEFTKRGVAQYYNASVTKAEQNAAGEIKQVVLTGGTKLPCDLLILAVGAKANAGWLKGSRIKTDECGLVIDEHCRTNCDDVYGAGDVTGRNLIWPVAAKEGRTAAFNMTGTECRMTDFFEKKATINIFDIPTMSFGLTDAPDDTYKVEVKEAKDKSYSKLIYKDGRIYGAILLNDMYYTGILNQLKYKDIDVSRIDKPLLDLDYADLLTF
jgi:NAD(P)H-nitrite reductase large subunit